MIEFIDHTYAAGRRMPVHEDRVSRISIVARGTVRESVGRREEAGTASSVVVKPAGVPHANLFGPEGARLLSIQTDDSSVFHRWCWFHRGSVAEAAAGLIAAAAKSAGTVDESVEECAWQLLAALECESAAGVCSQSPPRWLRRVRDRLHEDVRSPVSVSALARDASVHPVHLTRAFRRYYRTSVTGYRRQLRARAAAHRLASTEESMTGIALECGFSDQSHMCRQFRRSLGLTPGRFRLAARNV